MSNALRRARYAPIAAQGEITGTVFPDHVELAERRANAADGMVRQRSYPGGSDDSNHFFEPGDLVFGARDRRMRRVGSSKADELGWVGLGGLHYGAYASDEAAMRDVYFIGVSKNEYAVGGDNSYGTRPPEHGVAVLRAGSYTLVNNGPGDIYAGDLVAWRYVPTERSPIGPRNGVDPLRYENAGAGAPLAKLVPELVRFDYTDFSTQLAGAYAAMKKPSAGARAAAKGISDLGIEDFFGRPGSISDAKDLTTLQEEAMGFKYGLAMVVLRGIESLANQNALQDVANAMGDPADVRQAVVQLAQTIGLFENRENAALNTLMADVLLRNVAVGDGERVDAMRRFESGGVAFDALKLASNGAETRYAFLADRAMEVLCSGIAGAWHAKTSRVIGKAMSSASRGGSINVMVSHFKPGF